MTVEKASKLDALRYSGILGLVCAGLLTSGLIMAARTKVLETKSKKNIEALNSALPGFNDQSINKLKQEISRIKLSLAQLSGLFDNKEKLLVKDYELTIYFIDELNQTNQTLKKKAEDKKAGYPGLGFKEQLPSELTAVYLLSQLNCFKAIVDLGLDYGVNFLSITPEEFTIKETSESINGQKADEPKDTKAKNGKEKEPAKDKEIINGAKALKSHMEMIVPGSVLVEFVLRLYQISPKFFFDNFALKDQEANFKIDLSFSQVVLDKDWQKGQSSVGSPEIIKPKPGEDFTQLLRTNNPFEIRVTKEAPPAETTAASAGEPKKPRFFYRGKAVLQGREVAVIEDTSSLDTVFLEKNSPIANFTLADFSESQAKLINTETFDELVIDKEEAK